LLYDYGTLEHIRCTLEQLEKMASHALAIVSSLGGYTSALALIFIAASMIFESSTRFFHQHAIAL
jgi:Co/Zn/Cd efflux system component